MGKKGWLNVRELYIVQRERERNGMPWIWHRFRFCCLLTHGICSANEEEYTTLVDRLSLVR